MKNKGFSIVELVVVLALMGILLAVTAFSLSLVSSTEAKQCITDLGAMMSKCKVESMSRAKDVHIKLHMDADGNIYADYYEDGALLNSKKLGKKISVRYTCRVGTVDTEYELKNNPLYLSYERDTGAIKQGRAVDTNAADGVCVKIVAKGGGNAMTMEIAPLTGTQKIS